MLRGISGGKIGHSLQQLQAESQSIETDVTIIKEDAKKHLEDIKQQMVQNQSLFFDVTADLEPEAIGHS